MNILLWIVFGAVAGWIASMIMKTDAAQGTMMDIVVGIVGAVVGGFLMETFGQQGVTGLNIYSLVVAVVGACVALMVVRMVKRA
jgi:uncharacterized membrane protein YeaQ/YmgE (transglycosylase-associated protein family)